MLLLILVGILCTGAATHAQPEAKEYYWNLEQPDTTQPPGFKQFRLGMTHEQVNQIVAETPWTYRAREDSLQSDLPRYSRTIRVQLEGSREPFLGALRPDATQRDLITIGCSGSSGGDTSCAYVYQLRLRFFNGQLYHITIEGQQYLPELDRHQVRLGDRRAIRWARTVDTALALQYGKRTFLDRYMLKDDGVSYSIRHSGPGEWRKTMPSTLGVSPAIRDSARLISRWMLQKNRYHSPQEISLSMALGPLPNPPEQPTPPASPVEQRYWREDLYWERPVYCQVTIIDKDREAIAEYGALPDKGFIGSHPIDDPQFQCSGNLCTRWSGTGNTECIQIVRCENKVYLKGLKCDRRHFND